MSSTLPVPLSPSAYRSHCLAISKSRCLSLRLPIPSAAYPSHCPSLTLPIAPAAYRSRCLLLPLPIAPIAYHSCCLVLPLHIAPAACLSTLLLPITPTACLSLLKPIALAAHCSRLEPGLTNREIGSSTKDVLPTMISSYRPCRSPTRAHCRHRF